MKNWILNSFHYYGINKEQQKSNEIKTEKKQIHTVSIYINCVDCVRVADKFDSHSFCVGAVVVVVVIVAIGVEF